MSRTITNCVRHAFPIIEVPISSRTENSFCRYVAGNLASIERLANNGPTTTFVETDAYVEDRVRGVLREPYLDRFDAYVAIDLCTYLGKFIERHRHALSTVPTELRSAPVREIGFHVARQGETAIRGLVETVIDKERPEGSQKFLFGSLGRWLRSNSREPAFADLLELFQDIAIRNLPFGKGEMCFVPAQRRYLHTIVSAGSEYGLHEERIVRLLQEAELIEKSTLSNGRVYFDAERAHPILDAASRTLTSREAREMLGVSEETMSSFLKHGLLQRVEGREDMRAYSRIRREDLNAFRWRVFCYVTIGAIGTDMVAITRVCQRAACETMDVISALIEGKLRNVVAPIDHGGKLNSLRFDLSEAMALLSKERATLSDVAGAYVMNQREASRYMKVKPTTIPHLINLGLLAAVEIRNPVNGRLQTAVTAASMDAFMEEHVPVSVVAASYETHPIVILDLLSKIGVRPIYDNCGNVSRFFKRADVANVPIVVTKLKRR